MYKVSIILPTFNVEKYLQKSFDSLLNQTIGFSNLQIIYVDDCSTDKSLEIIDEFAKQYENVISVHLDKNSGAAGKPRNEGIKYALAKYLIFLDPDDYLLQDSCEVLFNIINSSGADIVVGGYAKNKNWIVKWSSWSQNKISLIKNPSNNLSFYLNAPGLTAKIFKKELILENHIKFAEKIPGQDLVFVTECFMYSKLVISLNDFVVYCYNHLRNDENNKSITNNVTKKYLYNLLKAYILTLNLLIKFNVNNNLIRIYFTMHHIPYFISQIRRSELNDDEVYELLNSNDFQRFINQTFIHENDKLNHIINILCNNSNLVDLEDFKEIWQKSRDNFIKSDYFIPELQYDENHDDNYLLDLNYLNSYECKIQRLLKNTAKINNSINDFNIKP